MRPARVEVHIEELVLHGFAPGQRYRIAEALERELTRLLAERGLSPGRPPVDGAFEVRAGARPEVVGRQVAAALQQAIGSASSPSGQGKGR